LKTLGGRSPIAINDIAEKIALAHGLRDVRPQEVLDIVRSVRTLLEAPPAQSDTAAAGFWRAECALNAAWANVRLGRFGAAYAEAEDGLRRFRTLGKLAGAAGCLLVMGIAKGEEGENDDAVRMCREAENLFLEIGDQFGRARAINASGTSYRRLGDSARAIEAYGTSMAVAKDNQDTQGVSRALTNIGYVYLYEKKYAQAIEHAKQALAMERHHGNLAAELSNCCNLVQALVADGRPQEAIAFMADYNLETLSQSGLFSFLELSQSLSMAYLGVGRTAEADALLHLGIDRARRDGNRRELGALLCTLARAHRMAAAKGAAPRADALAAARAALEEALRHGQSRDWDIIQGIHEEFCALCRAEGRWDEAFQHLEEAHQIALKLSSASADERLARQRSEQEAANHKARAEAAARQHEFERKALQSQKTESLGVLAGGMAHHFNNLLATILGNADLANLDPKLVPEALVAIKESVRRAADLCRQITTYTGRANHRKAAVNLLALVQESIRLLRVTIATECEFICEFPPEPIFVWGDRAQLQQVVLNLTTNSAEAKATMVRFQAAGMPEAAPAPGPGESLEPGDYVELSVADNGEGMTAAVLARVFEPFFSTKFTGRGLGMPAAMGIVQSHKGTMTAESTPGSGTTIRLRLPTAPGEALAPPPPVAQRAPGRGPRVVLIAEDDPVVRAMIVKFIGLHGWKTLEAADGEEAVQTHLDHQGQINLLISDFLMPKLNGLEAAWQIRSRSPELPVILMSGFTKEETEERFRGAGFEYFLKKPFPLEELGAMVLAATGAIPGRAPPL